jgi:hypothetical protein
MHKELVKVNENWNVFSCMKEMRIQAKNISRVYSIYVVDDEDNPTQAEILYWSDPSYSATVSISRTNFS